MLVLSITGSANSAKPVDTLSDEDKICSICGTQMIPIGTEIIRTEIVYTRPKLERIEYIATTYACPQCKDTEEPQFIKDNGRQPFIEGSYVSESLLSLIAYQKDGLNPIILYNYTPTRAGENARRFINGIAPVFYLMADGYQGYYKVQETNRCCCFAHIRRYLLESIPKGMEKDYANPAVQGFLYCEKLFAYERSYNLSENSIRPVTVGRKNWLFSDSPEREQANTLYLAIVEMAKAYGPDLYKYLNFLFEQRPGRDMSDEELEKLAPWNESVKELCSIK